MDTVRPHAGPRWQKPVDGRINAATSDCQRLTASVSTFGAVAQLAVDESTVYTAVYSLLPHSTLQHDLMVPTVHVYLSMGPPDATSRTYMLVQRLVVTHPRSTQGPVAEGSSTAAATESGSEVQHPKAFCLSKMMWAGATALAILRADGHLVVVSSGLRPTCAGGDASMDGSASDSAAPAVPASLPNTLLMEEHRVVDVATTVVTHRQQQLVIVVTAHHTHTAVTVLNASSSARASQGGSFTTTWPSVGPLCGLIALPQMSVRGDDGTAGQSGGSGARITFAGYDAGGCLCLFEWDLPESLTSSGGPRVESCVSAPRCLRQCMLGTQVHPLGLIGGSPFQPVTSDAQFLLVCLKPSSHGARTAEGDGVRTSRRGSDPAVLLGKNGVPLMLDSSVTDRLRALVHERAPLNQVYAMLRHPHANDGTSEEPPVDASADVLDRLRSLRIVRPRLSRDTAQQAALLVVRCSVVGHVDGPATVEMVEHTIPLHDRPEILDALLAGTPRRRTSAEGAPDHGMLLYPSFLLPAPVDPLQDGSAQPLGFVLYNANGLASFFLNPPESNNGTLSALSAAPHAWSVAASSGFTDDSALGGLVDLRVNGEGALQGVLLCGRAVQAPPTTAETDDARSDAFFETLTREVTVIGELQMQPLEVAPSRGAPEAPNPVQADAASLLHTEALMRRVVREELASAMAPLESRVARMESMLQSILERLVGDGHR